MRSSWSPDTLNSTIEFSAEELSAIQSHMPQYIASAIARKFVEDNWPKIKNDKQLMKEVKTIATEKSSDLIAKSISDVVSKSLGANDD